jgi:hypothetical protein
MSSANQLEGVTTDLTCPLSFDEVDHLALTTWRTIRKNLSSKLLNGGQRRLDFM